MKLVTIVACMLVLCGEISAVGQSRPQMLTPLFPIHYDPTVIRFDPAPTLIAQLCRPLHERKLWLYASWRSEGVDYFVVSSYIYGPDKGDVAPDEDGVTVALRGTTCTIDDASWTFSAQIEPGERSKLPKIFPEDLPGYNAPRICDKYGDCHYTLRSLREETILNGLLSDALRRYATAFGGKEKFLAALHRMIPDSNKLDPMLRDHLRAYEEAGGGWPSH